METFTRKESIIRMTIKAYKCTRCERLHEVGSDTYFKLDGALVVGESHNLIKGASTIFCLNCLVVEINTFVKKYQKPVYREG